MIDWGLSRRPEDRLVLLKRRLWRVNRLLLEHDLHNGTISLEEAAARLETMGYDPRQARLLARRYTFNPGYQTTYAWGLQRILDLKKGATGLPPGRFERILLAEGQLPFECFPPIIRRYGTPGAPDPPNTRIRTPC